MNKLIQEKQTERSNIVTIGEACNRLSLGQTTMRRIAAEADAVIHIGRCYRIRWDKVEKYLGLEE